MPEARTPSPLSRFEPTTALHIEHCASAVLGQKTNTTIKAVTTNVSSTAIRFLKGLVIELILKAIVGRNHEIHYDSCHGNVKPNWKTETHQLAVLFNFTLQSKVKGDQYKRQNCSG
jgi:hypothetical protein